MQRAFIPTVALFMLGMACGAPRDAGSAGHDGGSTPDANVGIPDAGGSTPDAGVGEPDAGPLPFATFDQDLTDMVRSREVGARIVYPLGTTGPHSVVLISHGGFGAQNGETLFGHIGEELASAGFVAVQVGHRPSVNNDEHRVDRPRDVSFLVDALAAGRLALPSDFGGIVDTTRVGHTGHSGGAYTAHAVAGAAYPYGTFRDPRIAAIAPISPQGVGDEFEAFDRGPTDSTWSSVELPSLILLGGEELDTNGAGVFVETNWRLRPFMRYPDVADRFQVIITGQEHIDMGARGEADVKGFIARNIRAFFDRYLRGRGDACSIGTIAPPAAGITSFERRQAASGSQVVACP